MNARRQRPFTTTPGGDPPRVLFAAAEVFPFAKTGGLADVARALPLALRALGVDVRIAMPAYPGARAAAAGATLVASMNVQGSDVRLLETTLPGSAVPVYLVDAPQWFDRPGTPYQDAGGRDFPDNALRFGGFCRVLERMALDRAGLGWRPHVFHGNDWHTGLAPALLSRETARPRTVFTIHTLAYQGLFPRTAFDDLQLPPALWSSDGLEFHGMLSFIKGGLVYADRLTTVSPTHAAEILTPEFGFGLNGLLWHRRKVLTGILNGVDYGVWDPRTDPHIAQRYWSNRLGGKRDNKAALQKELGLAVDDAPLLAACIARLTHQKGSDLLLDALPDLLQRGDIQVAVLGTGETELEARMRAAAAAYPGRFAAHVGYDEALAHRIQAGADVMLQPSRFEPCGLTHLYSMRYGTVPVVRSTGGLADTVTDASEENLESGTATGFCFREATAEALAGAVRRAALLRRSSLRRWQQVMRAGMRSQFTWTDSASRYLALYSELLAERAGQN
jgi:starch synthase